jgi:putative transcriptional regulator
VTDIKELRQSRGFTQDELAQRLGCSRVNISRYESGARRPRPEVAERIAALFGLRIEDVWEMFYASKDRKTN